MKHVWLTLFFAGTLCLPALAASEDPNETIHTLEEGRVYRTVNTEPILGRDVLNVILDEQWDRQIQIFVEHILSSDEIAEAKIVVSDDEVTDELKHMVEFQAKKYGMDPALMKVEDVVKRSGIPGGLPALKKSVKELLGMLRVLQHDKVLTPVFRTTDQAFGVARTQRFDKIIASKGLVFDPKRLGQGEAVRLGARGFSRDEVRAYVMENIRTVSTSELMKHLEILSFDRVSQKALKDKKLDLTQADREFHFSYMCRVLERDTGAPGREMLSKQLENSGLSTEQFTRSRLFSYDSAISLLAKQPIGKKELVAEFTANPDRYKRNENLIAHILLRVLDPEGHVYTNLWKAPGHDAVNNYVAQLREQQFTAARPKIEAWVELARQDFEGTAKKHSEDSTSSRIGGLVGRIGAKTVLMPPCDSNVRDAAIKLKPGEMSDPVRSDFGWHLLKCLEKQDVTYDEAAERVYLYLIQESRRRISDSLLANMKIEDKF